MESVTEDWRQLSTEELMAKKDAIEAEMSACNTVLESQDGVGMHGPLVDSEGYPRADIDVYAVRTARHRIICLRNDHKVVMKLMEERLHRIHADTRLRKGAGLGGEGGGEAGRKVLPPTFARVSQVTEGSPSALAGLKVGDKIAEFGSVTAANFTDLKSIADVVQHSVGCPVHVLMVRQGEAVSFSLTPQRWAGQGLLGCVIIPS